LRYADEVFRDRVDLLQTTGYLRNVSNMAMNMCAPFWWSSGPRGQAVIRGNGTMCYLNTGIQRIGVTCDHVFQGYLEDKAKYDEIECQFGNNTIDPERHLIDRSPLGELDLATFDVPEVFVSASRRNYHHNALKWPPDLLTEKISSCTAGILKCCGIQRLVRSSSRSSGSPRESTL
jgi:hypothetical protein